MKENEHRCHVATATATIKVGMLPRKSVIIEVMA